jgi:O-antigen ligase
MRTPSRQVRAIALELWPIILLVNFVSPYLFRADVVGYRWLTEFVFGIFLLFALLPGFRLPLPNYETDAELRLIILPLSLFATWSGASILWADSSRSSLHHTLLWTCFLLFYLAVRGMVVNSARLYITLRIAGITAVIISLACIIEYIGSPGVITQTFTSRFYVYAEVLIALMPIFFAVAVQHCSRRSNFAAVVVSLSWCAVMISESRVMFIAGAIGIVALILLGGLSKFSLCEPKRLVAMAVILIGISIGTQLPLLHGYGNNTMGRFSNTDENSVLSARSRLLMWGLAIEAFRARPLTGIGGDNYFADYKTLRETFSQRDTENPILEINEDIVPERAHNEYLQILGELGLVGSSLFLFFLAGVGHFVYQAVRRGSSLLSLGACAGMLAFLVSSGASSYSFRLPANGICFFFLLALALGETRDKEKSLSSYARSTRFGISRLLSPIGMLVAFVMIIFSGLRGISIYHLSNAQISPDPVIATAEITKAIRIDPSDPMFRLYYGQYLDRAGQEEEALPEMRFAIDNGLATSTVYFDLASVLMHSGKYDDAGKVLDESIRVYPRSVFLRTAYSSYLKRIGQTEHADAEFQDAKAINEKQARSWQIAHDEGLERLVQQSRTDNALVSPFDLLPASAPLVLANFQSKSTR